MKTVWIILILLSACTRPAETGVSKNATGTEAMKEPEMTQLNEEENFPDFVKNSDLTDSFLINVDKVVYRDFNADGKDDFASVVTNAVNGLQGVLILHNEDKQEYFVFGAGREVNGMRNLDWIDTFTIIPKGDVIAPTLVDPETGDIIGADETKEFRLLGTGIQMGVEEAGGGGILFWNGAKYEWYHVE